MSKFDSRKLKDVCSEITDGSHFSPKSSDVGDYPYVTVRDIDDEGVNFSKCKYIDEESYKTLVKNGCKPNMGDVLFSKDGTVGKVALVNIEKDFVVLSSIAIIRPKNAVINSEYLAFLMKSPDFIKDAVGRKTGTAIRRIILKDLKEIHIPVPSLEEQSLIVTKICTLSAETKKLDSLYQQNLTLLEELKKSILQKAFSGEL